MIGGGFHNNELKAQSSQTSNSTQARTLRPGYSAASTSANTQRSGAPTTEPNPNPSVGKMYQQHFEFYRMLELEVARGTNQLREELLGLLYVLFLAICKELYNNKEDPASFAYFKKIVPLGLRTFASNMGFIKTIKLLESVRSNKENLNLITPEFTSCKTLYISKSTQEVLHGILERPGFNTIFKDLTADSNLELKIIRDSIKETYKSTNTIIAPLKADEMDKINKIPINVGPLKDDAVFFSKLESFSKLKSEHQTNSKKINDKLNAVDLKDVNYLEKSNIGLPDTKLSYQINFLKHYIERQKLFVGDTIKEPSILGLGISDPHETITCTEFDRSFNVLLLGFEDSQILCCFLNHKAEGIDALNHAKKRAAENFRKHVENESLLASVMAEHFHGNKKAGSHGKGQDNKYLREMREQFNCIEFLGHEGAITSLSISYDELYFLSSSVDTSVRLWCIRQRTCLQIFKGHSSTVWTVKFCPKGYFFASGSSDMTARLWATDKPCYLRIFMGHTADVNLIEFVSNCNYLITSSYDKLIRIWELASALCVRVLSHNNAIVSSIAVTMSGNYFASGSEDGVVIVWDISTGEKKARFVDPSGLRIVALSFTIDEVLLSCVTKRRIAHYELTKPQTTDLYKSILTETMTKELGINDDPVPLKVYDLEDKDLINSKFHPRNFLIAVSRCLPPP